MEQLLGDLIAQELASLAGERFERMRGKVRDLAAMAEMRARDEADKKLHTTRDRYKKALSMQKIGEDVYSVTLDPSAVDLEEGYPGFNQIDRGLARGPKSKVSKDGHRYVIIPFDQSTTAAKPGSDSHFRSDRVAQASSPNAMDMGSLIKQLKGNVDRARKINNGQQESNVGYKGSNWLGTSGKPIYGDMGTLKADPNNRNNMIFVDRKGDQHKLNGSSPINPNIMGAKIMQVKVGKSTKRSIVTFRVASEAHPEKWNHPGFAGIHVFKDLREWAAGEMAKIVSETLSGT